MRSIRPRSTPKTEPLNTDAYLQRIGAARPSAPTAEALRALTRAHLERVPFENLEIFLGRRCPSLEPEDLYRKVVEQRRGGYCFELNKLFYLLLRELGYGCYCAAARILYRRTDPRPLSHRVILVDTADEGRWLCDVGYGGPGPKGALRMAPGEQAAAGEIFSIREEGGATAVYRHDPDGEHPLMSFRDAEVPEVDFDVLNGYFGYHPKAVFTQKLIVYRCLPDGMASLVADQFTLTRQGETVQSRKISGGEELAGLLEDCFGLELPSAAG